MFGSSAVGFIGGRNPGATAEMAEIVNLRKVRKQMKRKQEAKRAEQSRLAHGRPKSERLLEKARAEKARRELESHRIGPGDEA